MLSLGSDLALLKGQCKTHFGFRLILLKPQPLPGLERNHPLSCPQEERR